MFLAAGPTEGVTGLESMPRNESWVEQSHVALREDAGAVDFHFEACFFVQDQGAALNAVHEDLAVGLGLYLHVDLDVAVGVDRVAAALEGEAVAGQDERRVVRFAAAGEERVQVDARAVVFGVIERVVDRTLAFEMQGIFDRLAVSVEQHKPEARRELPVERHGFRAQFEVLERDVRPVRVERDRAAAQGRIGQVQRFAGFHRVVADVQDGLFLAAVRDRQRAVLRDRRVAVLIRDRAAQAEGIDVFFGRRDDQRIGLCGFALQDERGAAVGQFPLIRSDAVRIFDFHLERSAVRESDFHVFRLLRDDGPAFRVGRLRAEAQGGAGQQKDRREQPGGRFSCQDSFHCVSSLDSFSLLQPLL